YNKKAPSEEGASFIGSGRRKGNHTMLRASESNLRITECRESSFLSHRNHVGRDVLVLLDFMEVHVTIDLPGHGVEFAHVTLVLFDAGQTTFHRCYRRQFSRSKVDVGAIAQTVGEVTCGCGNHGTLRCDTRLVTHAQGAARHLHACTRTTVDPVIALFGELVLVHLGGRGQPQASLQAAGRLLFEQLACSAEVTDVGHARADEYFVDLLAGHF